MASTTAAELEAYMFHCRHRRLRGRRLEAMVWRVPTEVQATQPQPASVRIAHWRALHFPGRSLGGQGQTLGQVREDAAARAGVPLLSRCVRRAKKLYEMRDAHIPRTSPRAWTRALSANAQSSPPTIVGYYFIFASQLDRVHAGDVRGEGGRTLPSVDLE